MALDGNSLIASLLIGSVGFVLFAYGKKLRRLPHMLAGVILLVYPYFVANVAIMLGIGVALCVGLWLSVRLGA